MSGILLSDISNNLPIFHIYNDNIATVMDQLWNRYVLLMSVTLMTLIRAY